MIDQLIANIKKTNAPIVVGLDPMMKFIPEQIKEAAFKEHGETLRARQRQSGNTIRASWTRFTN